MENLDHLAINFNADQLFWINIVLCVVMYAVALEIRITDFKDIIEKPRMILVGLSSQFLLLPIITLAIVTFLPIHPSIALGLFLVAACPGGNASNFFSMMAKGNIALSVSLTSIATVVSGFMIPFGFMFWSACSEKTAPLLTQINVDYLGMMKTSFWLLVVPLVSGMLTRHFKSKWADKLSAPLKYASIFLYVVLVGGAFFSNLDLFIGIFHTIFWLALFHNGIILLAGYLWAWLFGLGHKERKTISLETGIQNTGIGLILAFNFFADLGGLQIIVAWWGIWHLVSGGILSYFYAQYRPEDG